MFTRELPINEELVKIKAYLARWIALALGCYLFFALSVGLLASDILWSWDGLDPILGERAAEGLALSILTSGLEMLPSILIGGKVVKKGSPEYYALWVLAGAAYLVDMVTNYLGLSVRKGQTAWGWQSDNVVATITKVGLSIVVSFMEAVAFWFVEAATVCTEAIRGLKEQLPS